MGWFLGLGIAGLVLLVLSLVFDGVLEGVFDGLSGGLDGFMSLPVIAGFLSMLGFAGAITLGTTGLGAGAATAVGALAGSGAGWLTWRFSRSLMRDEDSITPRGEDLVGSSGTVVTGIPADGYGEVLVYLGGQPTKFAAKSSAPVARGTEVWVESVLTATSVAVRPVER
jgi:membrane protein implicated in regulation of membrane protease activity